MANRLLIDCTTGVSTSPPDDTDRTPLQADAAVISTATTNARTVATRAQAALQANDTFIALATPTAVQTTAQVQRLSKECNALIRLLLGLLADVSDTA